MDPDEFVEVVRVALSEVLEMVREAGCVPRLRSGVPKVGRLGAPKRQETGYFGIYRTGTVCAMPIGRDG